MEIYPVLQQRNTGSPPLLQGEKIADPRSARAGTTLMATACPHRVSHIGSVIAQFPLPTMILKAYANIMSDKQQRQTALLAQVYQPRQNL